MQTTFGSAPLPSLPVWSSPPAPRPGHPPTPCCPPRATRSSAPAARTVRSRQQAERTGRRDRRGRIPTRAGGRRQRQHRHGGVQRRRPTTTARSPRASASRASTSRSTPAPPGPADVQGLTARGCTGVVGDADPPACRSWADRHAAELRRARPGLRRRPGGGVRPAAGRRRRVQLRQRSPPVLREPDLRRAGRGPVQGLRGDRGLAHRQPPGCGDRVSNGAWSAPGDRQQAELRAVLRQGAGLGRQRRHQPALRQRVRLLRGLPRRSPGTSPATVRAHLDATAATTWTQKQVTAATNNPTASRASGEAAARCAPTRTASCTCSPTPSRSARPALGQDPDGPVDRRRQDLDEPTHRRHGVRHLHARSSPRSAAASWTVSPAPATTCRRPRRWTSPTARPRVPTPPTGS